MASTLGADNSLIASRVHNQGSRRVMDTRRSGSQLEQTGGSVATEVTAMQEASEEVDYLQSHPKSSASSTTPDWDLSHVLCATSQSKQQLPSCRQELKRSAGRDRWVGRLRASPEQEAEELDNHYEEVSITVHSHMGALGISIAGGKESTPYKINDEGIFISKVSKDGPADLAGLQVGDMVLEVNGISLQNVTHREAVHALKNSGTVIKILILRDRAVNPDTRVTSNSRSSGSTAMPDWSEESGNEASEPENFVSEKMPCNRSNLGSVTSMNRTMNSASGGLQKHASFHIVNHTMPLPRITVTCPSTSDEDLEQLTLDKDEYYPKQSKTADGNDFSDYLNSAFYPP
ncbi:discs large homolog 1-like protein [Narcine bancroftii]|uniref:discs large homolog 1-like protein n=1 Tax=Narcine bancroftii TaxID=1343680 RepID=UPI0038321253